MWHDIAHENFKERHQQLVYYFYTRYDMNDHEDCFSNFLRYFDKGALAVY